MVTYPSPETWQHASPRQAQRAARSFSILKQRNVPVLNGSLMGADEDSVKIQPAAEVARRLLMLWIVGLRADGMPQAEVYRLVNQLGIAASATAKERAFLQDPEPDSEECYQLVWNMECVWVLLWAFGYIDALDWPDHMCDVPKMVEIMRPLENQAFITAARLRSTTELLDAQDLTMRIHWAIRDSYLKTFAVPEGLNWSEDSEDVPPTQSVGVAVVEQRHWTLNWLTCFQDPESWDHVDTAT